MTVASKPMALSPLSPAAIFTHGMCIACLFLQRFGLPLGPNSQLFLCLPIALVLVVLLTLSGNVRVGPVPALLYLVALASLTMTTALVILAPDFAYRFSLASIGEIYVLYALLLFQPSSRFNSEQVLPIFIFWARAIACLALLQYAAQFAGVRLFSFARLVPALKPVLTEAGFNVMAPIKYGSSIYRSNGGVLLEPSILSQVMALAIVVDFMVLKRVLWLPLYGAAILSAFAGTGPLVLALTLALSGLFTPRDLPRAIAVVMGMAIVTALAAVVFPEQFATLASRANAADPSSQARYGAQLLVLSTIIGDARLLLGFGPGAADGFVQLGSMSAVLKLLFDYGLIGLTAFLAFLLSVFWRKDAPPLTISALLLYQLGGGYLLFPPMVLMLALICVWSRPTAPAEKLRRGASFRSRPNMRPLRQVT